jgi:hypothetical protein
VPDRPSGHAVGALALGLVLGVAAGVLAGLLRAPKRPGAATTGTATT